MSAEEREEEPPGGAEPEGTQPEGTEPEGTEPEGRSPGAEPEARRPGRFTQEFESLSSELVSEIRFDDEPPDEAAGPQSEEAPATAGEANAPDGEGKQPDAADSTAEAQAPAPDDDAPASHDDEAPAPDDDEPPAPDDDAPAPGDDPVITPVPAAQRVGMTTGITPYTGGTQGEGAARPAGGGRQSGGGSRPVARNGGGSRPVAQNGGSNGAPSTRSMIARFIAGSAVIVVSMATATAVSLLLYLSDIAQGLSGGTQLSGVKEELLASGGGEAQTILILGNDGRPGEEEVRADTTILLRVDPQNEALALFALPRDLRVRIPGYGTDRLNAAYALGGPELSLRTVKRLTGLEINHLVDINFIGFEEVVDAINCVYIDVDRHYFHSNEGLPAELHYAEIDIPAGYQRLCGYRGLNYVRYRHTDNDIVRGARQQDFLREARQKMSLSRIVEDRSTMIDIFTRHTTSDIDDPRTMIEVLKNFIAVHDAPVHEVQFEGEMGESFVTTTQAQIDRAVDSFLGLEATPGGRLQATGADAPAEGEREVGSRAEIAQARQERREERQRRQVQEAAMIDATEAARIYAQEITTTGRWRELRFPILMPTRLAPHSQLIDDTRNFRIEGPDDDVYRGYKFVVQYASGIGVPEYYGVTGTDWEDPPILERPSETRTIDGRDYMLYYDAGRLRLVGWQENGASYWVSNTLLQALSESEMLSIATSVRRYRP